ILSLKPAQFFFFFFYSLYLWHWPIIVLYTYKTGPELLKFEKLWVFIACILAGTAGYCLIEKPCMKKNISKPSFGAMMAALTIAGVLAGSAFILTKGFETRFDPAVRKAASYLDYKKSKPENPCFLEEKTKITDSAMMDSCVKIDPGKKNILLLGDSHADHLYGAMAETLKNAQVTELASSGCRPLIGASGPQRCTGLFQRVMEKYLPENKFDVVILSGRWHEEDAALIAKTVAEISEHAKRVIVSGPIVTYTSAVPKLIAFSMIKGDEGKSVIAAQNKTSMAMDKKLREAAAQTGAEYFSVQDALCYDGACQYETPDHTPMIFDTGHLTHQGAIIVMRAMDKELGLSAP
ncbi:MAG: hypothetical protein DI551_08845, partial [Micavibrio aeruginosavorus]